MGHPSRPDPWPAGPPDGGDAELDKVLAVVQALMDDGRLEQALARLEAARARHPHHAPLLNKMGICLARMGSLEEAARLFRQAAELDPAYPAPWSNLGNVHLQQGRLEEAEAAYRRALAIDSTYAPAHNNLAAALRRMGRYDEAVHHLKQALRLQGGAPPAPASARAARWLVYALLGLMALLYWWWQHRGLPAALAAAAAGAPPLVVQAGSTRLELAPESLGLRPAAPPRPAGGADGDRLRGEPTAPGRLEGPDPQALERLAAYLDRLVGSEPQEPRLRVVAGGRGVIVPGRPGRRVDRAALAAALREAVLAADGRPVVVPVQPVPPSLSDAELEPLTSPRPLSRFVTRYDPVEADRAANIAVAARALDGLVVRPGGTFSFNEAVGPRITERGYRQAPVLINGQFTLDVGGGVCQTSTTLYNAALLAGLRVAVRAPHSRPVWYVPLARDATVAWGLIDLKLTNPYPYPVAFTASAGDGGLTVEVWAPSDAVALPWQLRTVVERAIPAGAREQEDPALAPGERRVEQPGRSGYVATLWRELPLYGPVVGRERVNRSSYPPYPAVERVGPPAPPSQQETGQGK